MCARLVRDWLTTNARTARIWVWDPLITSALSAAPSWRALLLTKSLQSASVLKARIPVRTVPSAKTAQAFRYLMCARLVRDWLTTNARTARIWVRDPLITSAFNATTSWRALLPTQTLQSASALITRFLVLTVPNVNAPTVRDWLMAQMTALIAAPSWRALLPTQTLQSASAPKARFPVLTVPSAKMAAQAFRYLMMCASAPKARFLVLTVPSAK